MGRNRNRLRSAPTSVYRIYDESGVLLYVGISSRLITRLGEHRRWSDWFSRAFSILVEEYETQGHARRAEAIAIRDELPLFNKRSEAINARQLRDGSLLEPMDSYAVTFADIWGD